LNAFGARPVDASDAVRASVGFDLLRLDGDGAMWLERRPDEGRTALVRWRRRIGIREMTPPNFDTGNYVHAYGGGSYAPSPGGLWCTSTAGGIFLVDGDASPAPATPITGLDHRQYGDLAFTGDELLAVRESATGPDTGDELVAVPVCGAAPRILARSSGFLAAPRPAPGRLAWLRWGDDEMPWDSSELWVAGYEPGGALRDPVRVAGGPTESVVEPQWGPDGSLYFASDRSGWWNLYRWDARAVTPVAPLTAECAAAPWELGYSSYAFVGDRRIAVILQEGPRHTLGLISPNRHVERVSTGYTSIKPYLAASASTVGMIASSATEAPQVALVDVSSREPEVTVLARAEHPGPAGVAVSEPVLFRVPRGGERAVTALLYPPTGAPADWRAPLIVRAHPGPTDSSLLRLDWQTQFFTSRGFAVVDVDYTGSTGYGRAFRRSLYGRWGIDDVADCTAVAEHLLNAGRAIAGQIFIRGASAGGYTALQAVSHDQPFAAATAISAIVDPDRWTENAPRFQKPHAARLQGGAGRVRADAVCRPVLLIHGAEDPVAPFGDALHLARELRHRDAPLRMLVLDKADHDVAVSGDAAQALHAEVDFYEEILRTGGVRATAW
jgi:poly(3-hydroxybutyrate) depolymerase